MSSDTSLSLPYAHLNLRRNPFGRLTREEKNRLVVLRINLEPYREKLQTPGYAVQFLKEGARNKTTHLLAIRRDFPDAPYLRFYEGERLPPVPESPVLFLDWLHVLPRADRARLLDRTASFGIVSHLNHGREFKRAGLDYELIQLPVYTASQMKEQVDRRIEWARRDPGKPVPTVSTELVARLLQELGDDLAVNDELYRVFEELRDVGPVELIGQPGRNHFQRLRWVRRIWQPSYTDSMGRDFRSRQEGK